MAGLIDKLQKMWNPPDDEYDEEYYNDDDTYEDDEEEYQPSSKSTSRHDEPEEASQPGPSIFRRNNKVINMNQRAQLHVVVYKPMSFGEDTRDIADSLMDKNAVVLNLERTPKDESRRIIDFLSGVAYANNGKIQKIATGTFIITPYNVDLSGEDLFDEFENSGVYF